MKSCKLRFNKRSFIKWKFGIKRSQGINLDHLNFNWEGKMIYHTESLWSLTNQISEVLASHTLRGTVIKKSNKSTWSIYQNHHGNKNKTACIKVNNKIFNVLHNSPWIVHLVLCWTLDDLNCNVLLSLTVQKKNWH